jgi:hypothetical protein
MIKANRKRDAIDKNAPTAIFEQDQSLGGFLDLCVKNILGRKNVVNFTNKKGIKISITNRRDWNKFINDYFRSSNQNETDRSHAENLINTLGIKFTNFIFLIDDISVCKKDNQEIDATRDSTLAIIYNLYDSIESFTSDIPQGKIIEDNMAKEGITVQVPDRIDANIIEASKQDNNFKEIEKPDRDRQEIETQIDFIVYTNGANRILHGANRKFKKNTGNDIWRGLDLRNLTGDFWNDKKRMRLIEYYNMPLHLQIDPNDSTGYQMNTSKFHEVYLDTPERILATNKFSLRVRLREVGHGRIRSLLQMKEELPFNPDVGQSIRQKWEQRWVVPPPPSLDQLVEIAQKGKRIYYDRRKYGNIEEVQPLILALYQKLSSKGVLPNNRLLLQPDHLILQKRTRTHLQLDSLETMLKRLKSLQNIACDFKNVPSGLTRFIDKVRKQYKIMEDASDAMERLKKRSNYKDYGIPSNVDAILISYDRWSAFEPSIYGSRIWPNSLRDKGLRGRGLRVETELDATTSVPFENAIEQINDELNGENSHKRRQELKTDRKAIIRMQRALFKDVKKTAQLMAKRMEKAGLKRMKKSPSSKSEAAMKMIRNSQNGFRNGHRFWV